MFAQRIGELAALGTAVCWTVTALSFEAAGKRVGSLPVNIIRIAIAVVLFVVYGLVVFGRALPAAIPIEAWGWLAASGLVGFVIGDLLLFQAFVDIGARVSMLIYSSVPPLTALLAWFVLGETLTPLGLVGMALTVCGIMLVVLKRRPAHRQPAPHAAPAVTRSRPHDAHRLRGVLMAAGGALGQAGGLVLGRLGAGTNIDPFAATQVRALAGLAGFVLVFTVLRKWRGVLRAISDTPAMTRISLGALFGPFLGVSLGLYAAQNTSTGVASTIMALVPVLIIIPAVTVCRERVSFREVAGSILAVVGVALLFL